MTIQNGAGNLTILREYLKAQSGLVQAVSYCGCHKIDNDTIMVNALGKTSYGFINLSQVSEGKFLEIYKHRNKRSTKGIRRISRNT